MLLDSLNDHIVKMDGLQMGIPDFSPNWQWFNSLPLSFQKELKGKVVVLDFWTYCCINCIHVLPDLAALEKKYEEAPVVFIGVHSAKFDNERDPQNIRSAILRYEISHPVVNDPEMVLWQKLGVHSWPTFIVIGPTGNILFSVSGEGKREVLDQMIAAVLKFYPKDQFSSQAIPYALEKNKIQKDRKLKFPGKLAIDPDKGRLFISDSNHHRIVVTSLEGEVLDIIGTGIPGFKDGSLHEAQFNRLQGLVYYKENLYIADAENHALRCANLATNEVYTLAGNGEQGNDYKGGYGGEDQTLSTPWDVTIDPHNRHLYIAMAGTHQIWEYLLDRDVAHAFSGSGAEQNYNSHDLHRAGWAQPSGISYGNRHLYIADSESSSIRAIDLHRKSTATLVGGDTNPSNLFRFGDQDGIGLDALLQHPLGVLWLEKERRILVADTYNHRIKAVDPLTREVVTWAGSGEPGFKDGIGTAAQFSEPAGFALHPDQQHVYIADANNHAIRMMDLVSKEITTLDLKVHDS